MAHIEILPYFENYFQTLNLRAWKLLSGIVFLHYYVRTIVLFFPGPLDLAKAFNRTQE